MVAQSREPFLLPCLGYLPHTAQSLGHSFPALCRARVGLCDVLLGPRPSLPDLRRGFLLFVRPVWSEEAHSWFRTLDVVKATSKPSLAIQIRLVSDLSAPKVAALKAGLSPQLFTAGGMR